MDREELCSAVHTSETMPTILGIWKNDVLRIPKAYEFRTWGEALDFYKNNKSDFSIMYHYLMPEVLPF